MAGRHIIFKGKKKTNMLLMTNPLLKSHRFTVIILLLLRIDFKITNILEIILIIKVYMPEFRRIYNSLFVEQSRNDISY